MPRHFPGKRARRSVSSSPGVTRRARNRCFPSLFKTIADILALFIFGDHSIDRAHSGALFPRRDAQKARRFRRPAITKEKRIMADVKWEKGGVEKGPRRKRKRKGENNRLEMPIDRCRRRRRTLLEDSLCVAKSGTGPKPKPGRR